MKRIARLAALMMIVACSDTTPSITDQLNLNRPVDIAFACWGGLRITNGQPPTADQTIEDSPQPFANCAKRSEPPVGTGSGSQTVPSRSPGQEDLPGSLVPDSFWYGFILQSEPGTVAISHWTTKPSEQFSGTNEITMDDANPLMPGKNSISVGENPVAIGTDKVGCKEVIANAGSCDLSILDINTAITDGQNAIVDRLQVTNGAGQPIGAKAAAMAMEPPGGTIGVECGTTATGLAYIAYPGCHLVAAVDTSNGKIVDGINWDATGVPQHIDPNTITCPNECGAEAVTPGVRPVTLDVLFDDRVGREVLAIGADNSSSLTVVDLDPNTSLIGTNAIQRFALDTTDKPDLGVTSVAITPQIGMGGTQGEINDDASVGGQAQFVYAVATDNTIRVVEIASVNKECDAQIDPRFLHDVKNIHQLSCLPVGDPTLPRRPGAKGPGIELIASAIPTSVAVTKVDKNPAAPFQQGDPHFMVGYYAFATAANGATYVINVDDDGQADFVNPLSPIATQIPLDIAHQLRDSIPDRGSAASIPDPNDPTGKNQLPICDTFGPDPDATGGNAAGPRATDFPARVLPAGSLAPEKIGSLPSIRQVKCVGTDEPDGKPVAQTMFAAPLPVRDATFPDLRGLRGDETWSLTWEGNLSIDTGGTANDGPSIRESQMFIDAFGAHIVDATKPFCDAGVEQYDIVQLKGCDPSLGDADCALGYTCFVHPESQVAGLGACMLKDEADRLANACKPFLTSLRTYTVGKSTTGQLDLLPRKHVLRTTPVDGCTDDNQCKALADYALKLPNSLNPVDDHTPPDSHTWSCQLDPDRAPVPGTGKRCIETCTMDTDCEAGTICDGGTCMEGVVPPQACVNAAQRYELHAHDAFTVAGTRSGYVHPIIADANGACIVDPTASRLKIGRIPLTAPACDPTADPRTGKLPGGGFEANPCEETTTETELATVYAPANLANGVCTGATSRLTDRQADAIKFQNRGMLLELVDPTYPGDAVCYGDMGANLGKIPVVVDDVQTTMRITAGFSPLLLQIQPAYPVKVVRGPTQSIWVIDEGDYLSTSIAVASTRGKVFRVEGSNVTTVNLLQ